MNNKLCRVRITRADYEALHNHLFRDDLDEHGAVLLAGLVFHDVPTLCVREVHLANDGSDYVKGRIGHRALSPKFIHRLITRARDERLVYLAVHNHGSDLEVGFSDIDFASHELGYPALLQIASGMPVGALVFGRRSVEADLWTSAGSRYSLDYCAVVGTTISYLRPYKERSSSSYGDQYDRQIKMFGSVGQGRLAETTVAIVGLGGVGSLLVQTMAKLGVGRLILVDDDRMEYSNLSRVVGATLLDAADGVPKTEVANRLASQINPSITVETVDADVAKESVAQRLIGCDYIFLAADSMRARLVVNAITQQYLIPSAQIGSKIRSTRDGEIVDIMAANRPLRPGMGCLWCNQLIDPTQLAKEAKTDSERRAQAYGVEEVNPSVITLNSIAASHAANDFLLDYLGLRSEQKILFQHYDLLRGKQNLVMPRQDKACPECSRQGRFARASSLALPCFES